MIEQDFLEHISLPPRSRLYSLPIGGTSGLDQESLLDYAQHLSVEHCVRVRDLFSKVILPETMAGVLTHDGRFGERHMRTCNGYAKYARNFLIAMTTLTGQTNLAQGTFVPWGNLFDPKALGLLAQMRRWCPHCIEEQGLKGPIQHHLVWAIQVVEHCPTHWVQLHSRCVACARKQPSVNDAVPMGVCSHCGATLAQTSEDRALSKTPSSKEKYMASAVVELISSSDRAGWFDKVELFQRRIKEAAETLTHGSVCALERALKVSNRLLSKPNRQSLAVFLELTYRLGLTPLEFLSGTKAASLERALSEQLHRRYVRHSYAKDARMICLVGERLERALQCEEMLTTKAQFCNEVGLPIGVLNNHFPEVVVALCQHNRRIRPLIKTKKWEQSKTKIDLAMKSLVEKGGPFTVKDVSTELAKVKLSRKNPETRKFAYARLSELRCTDRSAT